MDPDQLLILLFVKICLSSMSFKANIMLAGTSKLDYTQLK